MQRDASRGRIAVVCVALATLAAACSSGGSDSSATTGSTTNASSTTTAATTTEPEATTTTTEPPYAGWVDPKSSGQPYGEIVDGQITFRGNPTRSYYGKGPVPTAPEVLWRYPRSSGMCGESSVGDETKTWCGSGWTGEPAVWKGPDGRTWVAFGAYDKAVHVIDGVTGKDIKAP
ncbi:MAG: hypothetical protein ACTHN0_19440, partial [Aquihabitans sp.]